jgi:hypothetical protein
MGLPRPFGLAPSFALDNFPARIAIALELLELL